MTEYAADDFEAIARRLTELRREADARTGASEPSPVDAAIRKPEPAAHAEAEEVAWGCFWGLAP